VPDGIICRGAYFYEEDFHDNLEIAPRVRQHAQWHVFDIPNVPLKGHDEELR